jgi:choline kinase
MTGPTLLVMAAGMGNRYGGLKQLEPVGPAGETIIDYSVFDALRAGFDKLVFVIRRDLDEVFRRNIGSRYERRIQVVYVYQDLSAVPSGFAVPPGRKKPWGTGQAILSAAEVISEPFAAINADDFYGSQSFRVMAEHLRSGTDDYAMVGFVLRNTLSDFGSVARGVCRVGAGSLLENVMEIRKIVKDNEGATYTDALGQTRHLSGSETVSMSMWGFTPALFRQLRAQFLDFMRAHGHEEDSEFLIPTVVSALVDSGQARCRVLPTTASWFGVTYQDDRPLVVEGIRRLVARGDYPADLWA